MEGIVINQDFDLKIEVKKDASGKIVSGIFLDNIDYQRCHLITIAQKGEFKANPTLGFGIENYMRDTVITNKQKFKTELQKELKTDGVTADVIVSVDSTHFNIMQKNDIT
ncbi:hypothetical protein OIU80_19900 [Flavobacterium sp. LS1R47]|uniref:Uncharacterized protein n=1 Tax=Flavobacterium frigoritolerans TaxID=2987686 RepID=A0A9X3HN82_9FLAO|nr:hypothetical protein [Flavobacterium frigoritolerans]MCV9934551.1 hypothetical protein [Flavobacterium frigoritolerans]